MKKIFVLIILTLFLAGCTFYNLTNFVMPDDAEFLAIIESLDTPKKICEYMYDNFEFQFHILSYSPYKMWLANLKNKAGDCNDMSCFAVFVANYNGYETYQIFITFKGTYIGHSLGVFVEESKYTYSSNQAYKPINVDTFKEIVTHFFSSCEYELQSYKVYDYNMNLIEVDN